MSRTRARSDGPRIRKRLLDRDVALLDETCGPEMAYGVFISSGERRLMTTIAPLRS